MSEINDEEEGESQSAKSEVRNSQDSVGESVSPQVCDTWPAPPSS